MTAARLRKVVFTIGQLGQGGAEGQVSLLAQELQRQDIEVSVASLFKGGPHERPLANAGVKVLVGNFPVVRTITRRPLSVLGAGRWLLRTLAHERPDVVHGFLYHAYVATAPAARAAGVPVVVAGRRSLGTFKENRRGLLVVERGANWLTDAIVANSHAVKSDVLRQEHVSSAKVHVIHNGLPASAFDSVPPRPVDAGSVVVSIGNLLGYKGHSELIRAIAELSRRGCHSTLVIVGEGPLRQDLTALAHDLAVDLRLFAGISDVRPFLRRATIFVHPSHEEGFSNALLEAMAQGVPAIATDVGGNSEALGDTGVLVSPRNVEDLASAMTRLLADTGRRRRLGLAAQRRARDLFSISRMVERHIDLYEKLLAAKRPGGSVR